MKAGFFSPYIIVPKKSGGLRPILGLRILNWAFHKPPFKMLMQNRIFGCIRPQVRSAAFDLKDPYFHVSILPCHRPFLQFAFEGRAYQYKVLPFGLSLSPRVFTKVAEAALVSLREHGVRILNYLDDWLILAQSQDQLYEHRLCLRVNWEKSKLLPTQKISFLGMEFGFGQSDSESRGGRGRAARCGSKSLQPAAKPSPRGQTFRSFCCVHQPTRWSTLRRMSQLAHHLLLWSRKHLRSLPAIHIPGLLNPTSCHELRSSESGDSIPRRSS